MVYILITQTLLQNKLMSPLPSVSIVVPVFRSGKFLESFANEVIETLNAEKMIYEIILVEDHGKDDSWDVIEKIVEDNDFVTGIKLSRNYGQHNALLCGIRAANNEIVITMDDDGQHPCSELVNLVNKICDGYDVVYATPIKQAHGLARNLASVSFKWLVTKLLGVPSLREASAFRAFRTPLREAFSDFRGNMVNIDIMLTWGTESFTSIKVVRNVRKEGTSGYNFAKLFDHAVNTITGFSGVPLRISSYVGLLFAFFGFLILVYTLAIYMLYGSTVPGFAFIASLLSIFSGVQLLTIGIIGEYVSRIHFRSMDRPAYLVKAKLNSKRK
ncbi:MAG: glycosyltransferase involved in cell wall biosynthesis [Oleiphilaceae bacterium]